MNALSWIRKLFARPVTRPSRKGPARCRLTLEDLESRVVPAGTFTWNATGPDQNWSNPANWSVSGTTNTTPRGDGTENVVFNNLDNQISKSNPARLIVINDVP